MSTETTSPQITASRRMVVARLAGLTEWMVDEFDGGARVMLVASAAGTQYVAHFSAKQWAEFQAMVMGEEQR